MPSDPSMVLHVDRTEFFLAGIVRSSTDPTRQYHPSIQLSAVIFCPCDGGVMQDRCSHPRAVLETMEKDELVEFILAARTIPPPFDPAEDS